MVRGLSVLSARTTEKATDERATDESATDVRATDESATDVRATDESATDQVSADPVQRRVVVRERLRFARDLHDLLGPRLLAITLQCELALRLMERTPETARNRLAEALCGMREIQEEARRVAHGYHCLSLDTEIESVRCLLEAAGVRAEARPAGAPLPPPLQTVLATTVREAAANVLRHSRARSCRVAVETPPGEVVLTVSNDGVRAAGRSGDGVRATGRPGDGVRAAGRPGDGGRAAGRPGDGGRAADRPSPLAAAAAGDLAIRGPGLGLCSLGERIAAVGGRLTHGPYPSGHYTLEARFPLPGPAPDGPRVPPA
ncbi:sensor histidine kinase [Streptomyces sp. bgisy029]|uniref:sensor histidine kinase n=1 Tax=Streptomyces sp. bgisy029 TaxID=3413771 RepID=UPI003D73DA3D